MGACGSDFLSISTELAKEVKNSAPGLEVNLWRECQVKPKSEANDVKKPSASRSNLAGRCLRQIFQNAALFGLGEYGFNSLDQLARCFHA